MRTLLYIVILAAVIVFPNRGTDVGKLIPVEVIAVSESNGMVSIRTDTEDEGKGATLAEAVLNLKETSKGVIYLDTAEYLILGTDVSEEQMLEYLKGNTKVYRAEGEITLSEIADFLSVHKSTVCLREAEKVDTIPVLTEENGRNRIIHN